MLAMGYHGKIVQRYCFFLKLANFYGKIVRFLAFERFIRFSPSDNFSA